LTPRQRLLALAALGLGAAAVIWGGVALVASAQVYVANLRSGQRLPPLEVPGVASRILIVAPHPDDETLGCGGLIQQAERNGAQVYVVLMTNGDASEMALLYERDFRRSTSEYLALGRQRLKESLAGLSALGVPPDHVFSLGYPNEGLDTLYLPAFWRTSTPWLSPRTRVAHNPYMTSYDRQAVYSGENVVEDLARLIDQVDPDVVFCAAPFDIHPDHWAAWGFTRLALERARGEPDGEPRPLYAYLVHRPDWPAPRGYLPNTPLDPPASLAQTAYISWFTLPLAKSQVRLKAVALRAYRSQALKWDWVLVSEVRANELFATLEPRPTRTGMVVIQNPVGDPPAVKLHPEGNLSTVMLSPGPQTWHVAITVAGKIDPFMTYYVLGHGLEGNQARAWLLTLSNGSGEVTWAEGQTFGHASAPWTARGQTLESEVPAALFTGRGVFVEAYTSLGPRLIDHTVTAAVPRGWGNTPTPTEESLETDQERQREAAATAPAQAADQSRSGQPASTPPAPPGA
jgi:LmbE family N-acetylglucosaminyl deacetylase